ncbi:MAG TPA: AraC family transcriptional regulator [Myxococcales bacterium]|nr:AraC family transcriptional regulator [Myxococcales bacterium]
MIQIAQIQSGAAWMCCGSQCARVDAGDVVVSAPGFHPRVQQRLTASAETLKAFISPRRFSEEMRLRGARELARLDVRIVREDKVTSALKQLCAAVEEDRNERELQRAFSDLLDQLVRFLSHESAQPLRRRPPRPEIEAARQILQDRFAESVSLDELTEEVGLSKFHLLRLFRVEVGTTPHAYQLHLRIARAREMLDRGVSAAEVALACGFADQAHFTRCFKSIVGFTPAAFARLG